MWRNGRLSAPQGHLVFPLLRLKRHLLCDFHHRGSFCLFFVFLALNTWTHIAGRQLHLTLWDVAIVLHRSLVHFISLLIYGILLYEHTTVCLFILLLTGVWVVSSLGLKWKMQPRTALRLLLGACRCSPFCGEGDSVLVHIPALFPTWAGSIVFYW